MSPESQSPAPPRWLLRAVQRRQPVWRGRYSPIRPADSRARCDRLTSRQKPAPGDELRELLEAVGGGAEDAVGAARAGADLDPGAGLGRHQSPGGQVPRVEALLDVGVGAAAPDVKAETASGSVRVELTGDVREVEISTASGTAEAVLPANFAGQVELETASGDVEVDFPMTVSRQTRHHLRGTIGQGGSARVSVSAASGDVRVLRR